MFKRTVASILVLCVGFGITSGTAFAAGQQSQTAPTQDEIQQKALQEGPATPRIGYLTHKEPRAPHRAPAPVDPRLMKPLTQREIGMLYNACIAYAECRTAYDKAYEHNQALLRAQKAKDSATGDR